jgi:phospholipid/cholesterol/gamma-HCH transport system permease protein
MDSPADAPATLTRRDGVLVLSGRLDAHSVAALWREALAAVTPGATLAIDLSGCGYCDVSGSTLLLALEDRAGSRAVLHGASPRIVRVIERAHEACRMSPAPAPPPAPSLPVAVGEAVVGKIDDLGERIAILGRTATSAVLTALNPRSLRWPDTWHQAEEVGSRALPLICMIGFLFGLILAFQSAVPLRQFGADIFVANLVAVSVFRELGPLLSAVILAARSGSAFAAEIGTMKVNEEIDALNTMGLDPFRFLVMPRLIAAVAMMPVLIIAMNLSAVAGMAAVMMSLGFPWAAISGQVVSWTGPSDVLGGLAKGLVFGAVVAGIGCSRGMSTGVGPRAVGEAATAAVVGGIVAIIVLDGIFAVLFYLMEW